MFKDVLHNHQESCVCNLTFLFIYSYFSALFAAVATGYDALLTTTNPSSLTSVQNVKKRNV